MFYDLSLCYDFDLHSSTYKSKMPTRLHSNYRCLYVYFGNPRTQNYWRWLLNCRIGERGQACNTWNHSLHSVRLSCRRSVPVLLLSRPYCVITFVFPTSSLETTFFLHWNSVYIFLVLCCWRIMNLYDTLALHALLFLCGLTRVDAGRL
jgi:hypothetical protein